MKKRKPYTKLTAYKRDLLAIWKTKGLSNLGRDPSTIERGLKRNCFRDRDGGRYYVMWRFMPRPKHRLENTRKPIVNIHYKTLIFMLM